MNICRCGTQAGYPHSPGCPYPCFSDSKPAVERWQTFKHILWTTEDIRRESVTGHCPVCGKEIEIIDITANPLNPRLIGSCRDAFTYEEFRSNYEEEA